MVKLILKYMSNVQHLLETGSTPVQYFIRFQTEWVEELYKFHQFFL